MSQITEKNDSKYKCAGIQRFLATNSRWHNCNAFLFLRGSAWAQMSDELWLIHLKLINLCGSVSR